MPKTVVFEGVKHTFPDDFTDEDIAAALEQVAPSETPAEAAPKEPQGAWDRGIEAEKKRFGEFAENVSLMPLLESINPVSIAKSVGAVADVPRRVVQGTAKAVMGDPTEGQALVDAAVGAVKGVGRFGSGLLGLRGAKGTAESFSDLMPSALPVGGILSKIGKMDRVGNIVKATGATKLADKLNIEELVNAGRLDDVPISSTRGGLAKKIQAQIDAANPELEAAKAGLQGLDPVSVKPAVDRLKAAVPEVQTGVTTTTVQPRTPAGLTAQKPAPVTVTTPEMASLNQPLRSAINKQIDELIDSTGSAKTIKPDVIQTLKKQAQDAADKAYQVAAEAGQEAGVGAQASKEAAAALQNLLETHPGIPEAVRTRLTKANQKISPLLDIRTPTEAARIKNIGTAASRSAEMLAGRGLLPLIAGGAMFSGPLGAAAGLGAHAFMQSTLFNTLAAASKLKVARIMATEGTEAAVQAAFAAHIAENAARRSNDTAQ